MANISAVTVSSNVLTVYVDSLGGIAAGKQVAFAGLTLTPLASSLNGTTQTVTGTGTNTFTVAFVHANFPTGSGSSDAETGTATVVVVAPNCGTTPAIPIMTPPRLGGWTANALIELADRRTERRGSKTLDLNAEFVMALQHLCMEKRWYWRRKFATIRLQAGVWQYDLSQPASNCGAGAGDFQQFVKHGVRYYPNPGNPSQWGELTPMFERDQQAAAIYSNAYYPQPQPPRQYFVNPHLVLNIVPLPDNTYPMTLDYWACPVIVDSLGESIPLVPAWMHQVLVKRLEAQIFRYTLGEGAAKYQAAMGEYNALVALYSGMDGFVPGEHIDWSADDDYESTFENAQSAVQSTR